MKSLEEQIREVLIKERTDELVKTAEENPEFKEMTIELMETMMVSFIESSTSSFKDYNQEEKEELKQKYRKVILPQIQAEINNPKKLREALHNQAKNQYKPIKQLKEELKNHVSYLRESKEMNEEIIKNYEISHNDLFKFLNINDDFVKKLTKVAKNEGIDKATKKDTMNSVLKEIFPTPEKYRIFAQKSYEVVENQLQQAQNSLMADGEFGKAIGGLYGAMGEAVKKAKEMQQRVQGKYLEKKIQEIYG